MGENVNVRERPNIKSEVITQLLAIMPQGEKIL